MSGIYGNIDFLQHIILSLKLIVEALPQTDQPGLSGLIDKFDESVNEIMQCVKHQKAIVDNVLDLSKLESNRNLIVTQSFSMKGMIEETLKIFSTPIKQKNLQLIQEVPTDDFWIKSDSNRLKMVLINLITNAIKFTKEGYIKVTLKVLETDGERVSFMASVADTGTGMTQEQLSNLFQRFARASGAEYEGSGLGLFISKRTIECMGGMMEVQSQHGVGSQFAIRLPTILSKPEVARPSQGIPLSR